MTAFDLLKHVGSARDEYVLRSRKRPGRFPVGKIAALAAAAVLVVGLGATAIYLKPWAGAGSSQPETLADHVENTERESPEESETQLNGMGESDATVENPLWGTLLAQATYPEPVAYDDYEGSSRVWTENQISDGTRYAVNEFSYKTAAAILKDTGESGCFSPLSLYQTLAILASGAEGQTCSELLDLLGQSDLETLEEEAGKLYRVNYADNEINRLQIANSLWLDDETEDGMPIAYHQDWVLSAAADYYADVYAADFSSEDTQKTLWEWIDTHTGGVFRYSSKDVNLSDDTVMAVVNTLWYKTQWSDQFREENTASDTFTEENGGTVACDFMHRTEGTGVAIETAEYTKSYLQLNRGSMIFVLPKEGISLDSLLTEEKLREIFENGNYNSAEVRWSVPKFETNSTFELADTLKALGMASAFEENAADFSRISDTPLYLSRVQQGTRISVNEDGVEAAAYTDAEAEANVGEGIAEEVPVVEMNLNRPFLYLITANDGSTLFLGTVRMPQE